MRTSTNDVSMQRARNISLYPRRGVYDETPCMASITPLSASSCKSTGWLGEDNVSVAIPLQGHVAEPPSQPSEQRPPSASRKKSYLSRVCFAHQTWLPQITRLNIATALKGSSLRRTPLLGAPSVTSTEFARQGFPIWFLFATRVCPGGAVS